ncbi:NAD(P)-binding domain-containing protein [Actinomadura sp. 6N118]|uniref:NAD(P)-binding domain-containing protein n=1 Tax=Actinomadura sp. 6N118 TaxID=3375151 RepID=UPI0037965A76
MTDNPSVTIIGLGSMGQALANAYLEAGHPTTVWNRTAAKADALAARGATRAATVSDALWASDLVVLCVLDYAAVDELLTPNADILKGRVLVNLTNGQPEQARRTGEWATTQGAEYLDGGIMAIPSMIGTPEAFILYSGSQAAFDRHEAALEILAVPKFVGADAGLAALNDLALLSGMYGTIAGARHATALIGPERAAEFTTSLLIPWLQAMANILAPSSTEREAGDIPSEESPLDMQAIALANIVQASRSEGVSLDLLAHLLTPMRDIIAAGEGDVLTDLVDTIGKEIRS